MPFLTFLTSALAGLSLIATPIGALSNEPEGEQSWCGVEYPSEDLLDFHRQLHSRPEGTLLRLGSPRPVDVYIWHVYTKFPSPSIISEENIAEQMGVLNACFKPVGITFQKKIIVFVKNKEWVNDAAREVSMFSRLRQGDYRALNVYFIEKFDNQNRIGAATYPKRKGEMSRDGVVMLASAIFNGTDRVNKSGKALCHEVGHWIGLQHTVSNSCSDEGDLISDTAASIHGGTDCPRDLNTCPDQQGLDPTHNHMSYSQRDCSTEFTQGQILRMRLLWEHYRESGCMGNCFQVAHADPARSSSRRKYK